LQQLTQRAGYFVTTDQSHINSFQTLHKDISFQRRFFLPSNNVLHFQIFTVVVK